MWNCRSGGAEWEHREGMYTAGLRGTEWCTGRGYRLQVWRWGAESRKHERRLCYPDSCLFSQPSELHLSTNLKKYYSMLTIIWSRSLGHSIPGLSRNQLSWREKIAQLHLRSQGDVNKTANTCVSGWVLGVSGGTSEQLGGVTALGAGETL